MEQTPNPDNIHRRFTKLNPAFTCLHCHKAVPPSDRTARNHCPYCLHSRHVDINPGDRAQDCGGLMRPQGYEFRGKKGLSIEFVCLKCQHRGYNIALLDGETVPDDYDQILALTPRAF